MTTHIQRIFQSFQLTGVFPMSLAILQLFLPEPAENYSLNVICLFSQWEQV